MTSFSSLKFTFKKQKNEFDSILPLTNKSSNEKQSSLLGYFYNTSVSIGCILMDSYQVIVNINIFDLIYSFRIV